MSTTQKIIFVRESKTVMNRSIVNEFIDSGDFEDFEVFKTKLGRKHLILNDIKSQGILLDIVASISDFFAEHYYE